MSKYDIIGDIHGHYDELISLILKLGYTKTDEFMYVHPEGRILIFVGDLIDRGDKIRETLQLVRTLVENGLAHCIKGNHEYNAINFWTHNHDGGYYRKHTHKNIIQHYKTIDAFKNRESEWKDYLKWMDTLPVMLEMDNFRVVHASFHPFMLNLMDQFKELYSEPFKQNAMMTEVGRGGTDWKIGSLEVSTIIEETLKGIEVPLPDGVFFFDKENNRRTKARANWWFSPIDNTYDQYLEPYAADSPELKNKKVDSSLIGKHFHGGYPVDEKPIFFGHYWLKMIDDKPRLQAPNVCCLDYSVAKKGHLVCYRYDNETVLSNDKFVYVESK
jgi:hypothetical protein